MRVTLPKLKRSTWKGPHIVPLKLYRPDPAVPHPPIKTMARSCTILPNFVGLKFAVHNGKVYNTIEIKDNMVGYKLGDFSPTRKRAIQDGSGGKR